MLKYGFSAPGCFAALMATSGTTKGVGNQLLGEQGVTGLTDSQLKSGLPGGFSAQVWGHDASRNSSMPFLLELPPN